MGYEGITTKNEFIDISKRFIIMVLKNNFYLFIGSFYWLTSCADQSPINEKKVYQIYPNNNTVCIIINCDEIDDCAEQYLKIIDRKSNNSIQVKMQSDMPTWIEKIENDTVVVNMSVDSSIYMNIKIPNRQSVFLKNKKFTIKYNKVLTKGTTQIASLKAIFLKIQSDSLFILENGKSTQIPMENIRNFHTLYHCWYYQDQYFVQIIDFDNTNKEKYFSALEIKYF
ncbi:hypothetical protein P1X15_27835 [Runella sp. MFBS21]|uniref:hypothetical protein n=1 Tax=Runella sp. MFBS21 TaxID=3034018 RepID=UPI0023F8C55F|nr:hypothetical protein [Runella sp. MFBS21]MDF7821461.1 hypothetical protein [Runella sp. MFBS21]